MLNKNVAALLERLKTGNCFHEQVTLVAATKTRSPEEINAALRAGITDIGENKVQEFCDKFDLVEGGRRHFIGHLQTNKVKYLIGKTFLVHSLDSDALARELSVRSERANVITDVLIQINIGCEETKSGFPFEEGLEAYQRISALPALRVKGFMAMLPVSDDENYLASLVKKMRGLYDSVKASDSEVEYLSMGMSGDWELCLQNGANMIRLGTAIFGERNYLK